MTKLLGNKFADKVQSATLKDAQAWAKSNEKTMFCLEYLEAFSVKEIDYFWQDELEDRFEEILKNS